MTYFDDDEDVSSSRVRAVTVFSFVFCIGGIRDWDGGHKESQKLGFSRTFMFARLTLNLDVACCSAEASIHMYSPPRFRL